jgi:hypothetical protein
MCNRDTWRSGTGIPREEIKARAGNWSAKLKELASQQKGKLGAEISFSVSNGINKVV